MLQKKTPQKRGLFFEQIFLSGSKDTQPNKKGGFLPFFPPFTAHGFPPFSVRRFFIWKMNLCSKRC